MAFRTPQADGLTIPPNAAGDGNNPAAALQELQQPQFWGRYATIEALPNVGVVDGVTVTGTNPAANPAFANLRPGDVAFVQSDVVNQPDTLYTLGDRGTVGGSNAEWNVASFPPTRYDAHIGKARRTELIFRETFGSGAGKLLGVVSGAGAVAQGSVAVSGSVGPARMNTGTTAAGWAAFFSSVNFLYSNAILDLDGDTIGQIPSTLSTAAEEYDVHHCYAGEGGGNGFSISYRRTVSVNWQLVRWAAGVPTFVVDTGVPVDLALHRFRVRYDVASATATFYIDNLNVGSVNAIGAISGQSYIPSLIRKSVGTTGRDLYMHFARLYVTFAVQRPA